MKRMYYCNKCGFLSRTKKCEKCGSTLTVEVIVPDYD